MYVELKWFFADPAGVAVAVFEVTTGQRDLDIRVNNDGQFLTSISLDDVETKADECWSPEAEDEFSSLGLRILKEQRTLLTCRWDTLPIGGADLRKGAELGLSLNWNNNDELPFVVAMDPALAE